MHHIFEHLNGYYDKIYVLTIESAAQRREKFAQRFKGLDYTFFYGADKNKFSVEQLVSENIYSEELTKTHHRYNKVMRPGEIACSLSHKMMYESMFKEGFERILIFEDDAVPDDASIQNIPAILDEFPADGELLLWGWWKNGDKNTGDSLKQLLYHVQHSFGKLKWDHEVINNLYARPYSKHLKKAGFHDFTYAYGITRSGADKLIQMQTPVQYIADNLLAHASAKEILNAFIAYPVVFQHDALPDGTAIDSYIR